MNRVMKRGLGALRRRTGLTIAAASLFLLLSGSIIPVSAFQTTSDAASTLAAYNSAIYESAVYKFSNLRRLYPLKFDPITKSATVVTLTGYDYSGGGKYKPPFRTDSGNYYIWVSAAPEVQNLCKAFPQNELKESLEQLLGLKPNSPFEYFVTMEVTSGQIFRPAVDPDPTTEYPCPVTAAETDSRKPALPANCGEAFTATSCDVDYKMWFLQKTLTTYVISDNPNDEGYPWTRLGYTYNWKPGADKYGASEYVIKENSVVTIKEITPYQDYCRPTR